MAMGFFLLAIAVITDFWVDEYENIFRFELDNASHWEVEYFNGNLDWEVGDHIKIYFQPDIYHHSAENLDKHNHAFLIQMAN
jgi:hypothetical protein